MSRPVPGGRHAHVLQDPQTFPDRIAADPQLFGKFSLSGQPVAGLQNTVQDIVLNMIDHELIRFIFLQIRIILINRHHKPHLILNRS